jgi:hypothetical protein
MDTPVLVPGEPTATQFLEELATSQTGQHSAYSAPLSLPQDDRFLAPELKRYSFEQWLRSSQSEVQLFPVEPSALSAPPDADIPLEEHAQQTARPFAVDRIPLPVAPTTFDMQANSDIAFTPPAADYCFPPRLDTPSSSSMSTYSSWTATTAKDTAATTPSEVFTPAWWPFRNVKVRRDDENGIELHALLQQMTEEATPQALGMFDLQL